ncbi:PucR family transcriptional regulator ligand-binding domain-containing protein [Streptosporangium sandarakinum]|uniref:PucR family transcriptional regulator ligand-binding domain-containing protein n=1 Tax=Streptosporangium sandarakinum TaxID=1260955 RepID=UPI003D8C9B8E
MAPTLRTVVRRLPLRLGVLAGHDGLDRPVSWVAVSELEDPTPFLEGGELVLTTGMRLDADNAAPYVARLVGKGVTGLGLGVGLGHETVPAELVAAAARAGLPLVEVPRDTPFVAISKLVSDLIAAEQYDEISRAFAAQGRLTRAALRPEGRARSSTAWPASSAAGPSCSMRPEPYGTPPAGAPPGSPPSAPSWNASARPPGAARPRACRCPRRGSTSSCSRSAPAGSGASSPSAWSGRSPRSRTPWSMPPARC